jgi:hypothetical protein
VRRLLAILAIPFLLPAAAHARLFGDGQRYAAYDDGYGTVHVLDDAGTEHVLARPAGCRFAAVGSGRVLFDCTADRVPRAIVVEVLTGATTELRSDAAAPLAGAVAYDAVGEQWARIRAAGTSWHALVYVPLAGGETRGGLSRDDVGTVPATSVVADLDTSALETPMCAPLKIPRAGVEESFAAQYRSGVLLLDHIFGYAPVRQTLSLQRCGQRTPTVVSDCAEGCMTPTLGATALAWREHGGGVAYRALSGATRHWKPVSGAREVALTAERVVVLRRDGDVVSRRLR